MSLGLKLLRRGPAFSSVCLGQANSIFHTNIEVPKLVAPIPRRDELGLTRKHRVVCRILTPTATNYNSQRTCF